jgi:anti-sigma regulatory factor (Ser/Thr protein kinase)
MDGTLARISRMPARPVPERAYAQETGHGGKGNSVAMADPQEASVTLSSEPASVTTARRYVCARLAEWGPAPDTPALDSVRLIISELATNSVLHTCGRSPHFTVDVRLERSGQLHIGVTDSHPRRPRRVPVAVRQDHGRGMVIIGHLIAESGGRLRITPTADGGKTVWIMLPWAVPVP